VEGKTELRLENPASWPQCPHKTQIEYTGIKAVTEIESSMHLKYLGLYYAGTAVATSQLSGNIILSTVPQHVVFLGKIELLCN
jgi:hypothetical protein